MKLTPEAGRLLLAQRTHLQRLLAEAYLDSCRSDAEQIRAIAGDQTGVCVDIGGGLGGVSACLSRFWPEAKFIIADRDGYEGRKIDFGDDFGCYNSLKETHRFLWSAGVPHETVNLMEEPLPDSADFGFSVLSWGFHYPVSTHIEWAAATLKLLVIDCRAETGAAEELKKFFSVVERVVSTEKHEWYRCTHA